MKPPGIVVVGSSNTDMILRLPRIPRPGETLLGGEYLTAAGGKGANQAVAAARAGGQVTFVARVGTDSLGDQAVAGFCRERINVDFLRRDPKCPSGVALIFVSAAGENSIGVAPGANGRLAVADVRRARQAIAEADVLLVQLEVPLPVVLAAVAMAHAAGTPVILNPAPAQKLPADLLRRVDVLTPNESEASLLTGVKVKDVAGAGRAARKLRAQGVGTVIVTLGAKGALLVTGEGEVLVPSFPVEPLDTTAAGDVFNGALAVALGRGHSLVESVRFACAAAALSVTRLGAQPSAPRRGAIQRLLGQSRKQA
ncbi:MAG: ribokinase [Verrucomicrobiales bacterium]|nr:ribokinase [Verrucomicrobiales bacterium]